MLRSCFERSSKSRPSSMSTHRRGLARASHSGLATREPCASGLVLRQDDAFEDGDLGLAVSRLDQEFRASDAGHGEGCVDVESAIAGSTQYMSRSSQHVHDLGPVCLGALEGHLRSGRDPKHRGARQLDAGSTAPLGADRVACADGRIQIRRSPGFAARSAQLDASLNGGDGRDGRGAICGVPGTGDSQ